MIETSAPDSSLSTSALELFSNFSDILEYDLGCSKEHALRTFSYDLYTSSPNIFANGDVNKGEIDLAIITIVNQCRMSELRKLARVNQSYNGATISEKLAAANMFLEGGNNSANIEDAINLIVNSSDSLITAINSGNINAKLKVILDDDYDKDEMLDLLNDLASHSDSALICGYIENGTISSRDELDDILQADSSAPVTRLSR